MKEILETILKNLVEKPDEVQVTEKETETGNVLEVRVAADDMGRVIGRQGKIASSIRTVMKSIAGKEKKKITIEFIG